MEVSSSQQDEDEDNEEEKGTQAKNKQTNKQTKSSIYKVSESAKILPCFQTWREGSLLETREGRAEMRLERETGFRACLLGHIKEFEFYFKCHGKPFYGFEQEIDVIKLDLVFQLVSLTSL